MRTIIEPSRQVPIIAEVDVRRDMWELIESPRNEVPSFADCHLRATSPHTGSWESRQVLVDQLLTGEEVQRRPEFPDPIGRGSWAI